MTSAITQVQNELSRWLVDSAFPLWSTVGRDLDGGYFEHIDLRGTPVLGPRLCFTTARQAYVFSVASEWGWDGRASADHALSFLLTRFRKPDGLFVTAFDPATTQANDKFDLYDHAFVIFALAVASKSGATGEMEKLALETLSAIRKVVAHPIAGFEEATPRTLPLRANPHMHLFEAALEWLAQGPLDPRPWNAIADEIAELCLSRFIDPSTGALHEFFDGEWSFAPGDAGRIVEPGHQFEWAWLLCRWGHLRGRGDALTAARRMANVGETAGIFNGVAINELWQDLAVKDDRALLWPQTERLKAWVALSKIARSEVELDEARRNVVAAAAGLQLYLDAPVAGLWLKERSIDGHFGSESAPGRYLYHIVCAVRDLMTLK